MSDVDDDAEAVAGAHHRRAEIGETPLHRVFGLDIAELVRPVVDELQMTHAVGCARLLDALDAIFDEIGAFGGHDDRRSRGWRRAQLRRVADDVELLLLREAEQPGKCGLAPGVELARLRRPRRVDAPVSEDAMGRRVGDDRETGDGQAAGAHRFCDRLERRVLANEPSGVAVHVDGQSAAEQPARGGSGVAVGRRLSAKVQRARSEHKRRRPSALENSTPSGRAQVNPMALGLPPSLVLKAASHTAILPSRIIQISTPRPAILAPVTRSSHSPSQ